MLSADQMPAKIEQAPHRGEWVPRQALSHNRLTSMIRAEKLKRVFGNINAQYANCTHVDLPSEVKALQTGSSL